VQNTNSQFACLILRHYLPAHLATWIRRYGGTDVQGLTSTGNWRDRRSAARYAHVVAREEWERVDNLPDMGTGRGKAANE
jgi:hypothetical protein